MPAGWQDAILSDLGAPDTKPNIDFETAWADAEHGDTDRWGGVDEGGKYNPFDTTLPGPAGTTTYNSAGVENYPSANVGIEETVATLEEAPYAQLVTALRSGTASQSQLETIENATPWGTHFSPSNATPASPGLLGDAEKGLEVAVDPAAALLGVGTSSIEGGVLKIVLYGIGALAGAGMILAGLYSAAKPEISKAKTAAGQAASAAEVA